MSHEIAGARGDVRDRDAVLRRVQTWASARGSEVLLADASVVFGHDHLESAALHAERARSTGNMSTRSLAMEALLYLAGQRQVADAIRIAGIEDDTKAVAFLVFGDARVDDLLGFLGWSRDDRVLEPGDKDMSVLGVSRAERATVPEERMVDLALERTALVDITK
jgi:KEOPS complex subunit Cgi121